MPPRPGLVAFLLVLVANLPVTASAPADRELLVITECEHRAPCGVAPGLHPRRGDHLLELEGIRYADFEDATAFLRAAFAAAADRPVLRLKVKRGEAELPASHGESDGITFKTVARTPRSYPVGDARADLLDLFEGLERVYIESDRTREPWYADAKAGTLAALQDSARDGHVLLVDLHTLVARLLARFEDGHLDLAGPALARELDVEFFVEGKRGLPLPLEWSGGRYFTRLDGAAAPVELLAIDGQSPAHLVDEIARATSGDTRSSCEDIALRSFSFLHYLHVLRARGTGASKFHLQVSEHGTARELTIPSGVPLDADQAPAGIGSVDHPGGIPVLTLNGFQPGQEFETLISGFFSEVKKNGSRSIVIDQRRNGGGSSIALKALLCRLESKPFTIYERVRARKRRAREGGTGGDDPRPFVDRFLPEIEVTEIGPDDYYPPVDGAFDGRILLLIGPRNYSTSVDSIIALKNRGRVTTIGGRSGGRAVSPGDSARWRGVRTGLEVDVPVGYYLPKDHGRWTTREGDIAPDVPVGTEPFSGRDPGMEKALSLAREPDPGEPGGTGNRR